VPEQPFSRVKRVNLRQAIARREQAKTHTASSTDQSGLDPAAQTRLRVDEALLEQRVREEIARQLGGGKGRVDSRSGRKGGFDPARLRQAVRREVRRQFGVDTSPAPDVPPSTVEAADRDLVREAIQRVLSRRLHRQGEPGKREEEIPSRREASPAILEPLVRAEMNRLLGRTAMAPGGPAAPDAVDSDVLREMIRQAVAIHFRAGAGRADEWPEAVRLTPTDRGLIAKQVRAVLKRCLSRTALPDSRPLSDAAIDEIVKGALRGLRKRA